MRNENCMLSKPCPGCPFTADSIVSPERTKEIAENARRTDGNFICHKSVPGPTRNLRLPEGMTCRGFFDSVHSKDGTGQVLRIIGRLGGFKEVALTEEEIAAARASITPYREQRAPTRRTRKKKG